MTDNVWLRTSLLLSEIKDCIKDDLAATPARGLPIMAIYTLAELYKKDGQQTIELSTAVGNITTSFTWIVNSLEQKGLIKRIPAKEDNRTKFVYLTEKGKQLEAVITNAIGNAEVRYGGG